jgi:hypothetical protein
MLYSVTDFTMPNCYNSPMDKSPERAFALQRYLLLHSQHEALQSHLQELAHSTSSSTHSQRGGSPTPSPRSGSAALAQPVGTIPHPGSYRKAHRESTVDSFSSSTSSLDDHEHALSPQTSRSSTHAPSASASSELDALLAEEAKLLRCNRQIKSTLTELLNCESVRRDRGYSAWVQRRLMEAEMELKEGRRHSVGHGEVGDFQECRRRHPRREQGAEIVVPLGGRI